MHGFVEMVINQICRMQVAALAAGAGVEVDPEKPYAELWCESGRLRVE